ncbi:hypothetical protein PsYK624_062080 [Phanerochaete sordida]|uniref:F-box domain-containing protein n=1 Tax=Phanerochaete sordida TaxID=48140 RepID=A0A9P3LCB9_9APHY|nr:hypothetical protein PsYK624_062080 [Phanerochaete sordida]
MSDAERAMSDVAQAVIRLQRYLADITQYRNTLAVVSQLPEDVLLQIFTQLARLYETNKVYAAGHGSSRPYRWLYAVNTCRRWRAAALSYGSIWADIDLSDGKRERWTTFLERAGGAPLRLGFIGGTGEARRLLTEQCERIGKVRWLALLPTYAAELRALPAGTLHFSVLEELWVSAQQDTKPIPSLADAPMPRLRNLHLMDSSFAFARKFMRPTITRLYVHSVCGAPLDDWLDALGQLPELEQLHMCACIELIDQSLSALHVPRRVVHLRRLNKIALSQLDKDRHWPITHAYFLLHLSFSEDTALTLEGKCSAHPQWLADFEYVMTCIHRARAAASAVTRPAKLSITSELQLMLYESRTLDSIHRVHLEEAHRSPQLGSRLVLNVDLSLVGSLPTDGDPTALLASMKPLLPPSSLVSLSVHSAWTGLWDGLAGVRLLGAARVVLIDGQTMKTFVDMLRAAPGDPLYDVEELHVTKSRLIFRSRSRRAAAWHEGLMSLIAVLRARCENGLGPVTIQVQDRREVLSEAFAASNDDAAVARTLAGEDAEGWSSTGNAVAEPLYAINQP